jgi:phosphoglycerate dehydrogenase-like enzyme
MPDVVCLRPKADFDTVGVAPPAGLEIVYRAPADADVGELLRQARALVIPAVGPALAPKLFRDTSLRLVQITGAGLDRVDQAVLADEGIALANVPGGSNAAVAEYVTANALALSRGFFAAIGPLRAGNYVSHRAAMIAASLSGLGGLTVGLVGLGTIGLAVAERCHAMGAKIAYHDPHPLRDSAALDRINAHPHTLDDLFAMSDIVSLHLPLIDSTRKLMNRARFGQLKPGAILINAARGGIVDETALADALREGRIGGAAVDVFATEPPAPDNPLLTLDAATSARLILTPHIAGVSRQASRHLFVQAWKNVTRVLVDDHPPHNAIEAKPQNKNTNLGAGRAT